MKMINDLRKQLESIGATLDTQAEQFVVCDSPSGYVWRANGGTSLTIQYKNNGGQSWLAQALRAEMPSLKMGLEKVTDEKRISEIRWDLGDDAWGAPADAPARIEWPTNTAAPTATAMAANSVGEWGSGEIHYCPKCRFGVFSCEHDKATA